MSASCLRRYSPSSLVLPPSVSFYSQWRPEFPNSLALLANCNSSEDTFLLRDARHLQRITSIVDRLPALRAQRLPGASVSQSLYDKIGLTCTCPCPFRGKNFLTGVHSAPMDLDCRILKPSSISLRLRQAIPVRHFPTPFDSSIDEENSPEILRMSELQDSPEVQQYSSGVLYILASITPPSEFIEPLTEVFIEAVRSSPVSSSFRTRLGGWSLNIALSVMAHPTQDHPCPRCVVLPEHFQSPIINCQAGARCSSRMP